MGRPEFTLAELVGYEDVEARSHEALASLVVHLQELPEDIQRGIIERFKERNGDLKVTKDTVNIVIACEDIFANDK